MIARREPACERGEEGRAKTGSPFTIPGLLLIAFLCGLSVFSGCDEPFQPLKENDRFYFSIYGYLDASADTQWVRVSPVREQLAMEPVVPDMQVTLEHLQSGNKVILNDSLFAPGNGFNYLNYWTTTDIMEGETYRLEAVRPDGATSRVTVTTPAEYPTPRVRREIRFFGQGAAFRVFITGVDRLADVRSVWYVRLYAPGLEEEKVFSFPYRNSAEPSSLYGEGYQVLIDPDLDMERIIERISFWQNAQIEVVHRQVYIASGGPEWDDEITTLDDLTYTLPGSFSNVEQGLGYMVGIDSKWIPLESCHDAQQQLVACPEEDPFW